LAFKGGGSMTIPRSVVPGLERASAVKIHSGSILGASSADILSWEYLAW
jgi:hypothetical protein